MNKKFISLFALTLLLGLVLVNFTSAVLLTSNLGNFTEGTQFKVKFSFANDYGFAFYDGINLARAEGVCATSARYPLFDTRFDNCPSVCIPFSDPRHVDEFCTIHQREHLVTPATLGIHNIKISDFDFEGSRCQMNSELQVKRPGETTFTTIGTFTGDNFNLDPANQFDSCGGFARAYPTNYPANFGMNNLDSKTFNFNIVRANSINNTNHTNSTNSTNSTRPTLWVISPVNDGSYNTSQVLLNASSNQTVAWSYTLNGHAYSKGVGSRLVTVMNASNGLVNGVNTLIITISNANGTVTRTKDFIVNLNGNSNIPVIQILSPRNGQNYTLNVSTIPLRVISNQPMSNWNYSLNGVWNLSFVPNTVLKNVFNGTHVLIVCGRNANGSICNTSIFNVVSNISNPAGPAPVITIVDPIEGHTYNTANIPFKVTSNQPIIQWAYSLNGGTPVIFATPNNSTFSLNQILTLVNGNYALWAYGSNFNGSTGSDVRHFSVSITSPHDDDDDEDNDSDEDFMDVPVTNFTLGSNNFNGVITLGSNNTKPYFDWILFLKTVSLWILILILLILIVIVSILIVRNLQN